ncbi:ABC transporter permease [Lachnoclostridium sp. An131]|uniref:ABC transporter permease n=1 Tax=Lachnoclostridium sp. An131 TaxID=1965555 RepID=UPI000B3ACB32|nr:ABC transporter permease [Lachnoclostridium sp. An131]OUQ24403.1 ABC transporter permease [Lachnoclostridium sp. An131]
MLKLIKLEWKKNKTGKYLMKALIVALLLCLFILALAYLGIANDPDTGVPDAAPGKSAISSPIELFTSMCCLIFTSSMLSSFIISPYMDGTMSLMFSYPIKRQKILISQMLAVWIFSFAALVLTKLLLYAAVLAGSLLKEPDFPIDYSMTSPGFYLQLTLKSAVTVSMGFIALFIGLKMKSAKAALISSFLLIILSQANVGDITLADNALFPALLAAVSLIFAVLSVCQAETKDLM